MQIVDIASDEVEKTKTEQDEIKVAAAALGRKGGLKGGKAGAGKL